MSEALTFTTGVARLLEGDLFKPNTLDASGKPLVYKNGPDAGKPRSEYFIGIGIPKNDPFVNTMFQLMQQAAASGFPGGEYNTDKDFAWKYRDGDAAEFAGKEGYAGHYIFRMKTAFAPKVYNGMAGNAEIIDPNMVKRGYYIRVNGSIKGNGSPKLNPGLLINMNVVQLVAYGEEISNAPSADEIFGSDAVQLPPGATTTPVATASAPGATAMPGAPGATAMPGAPGATAMPGAPGQAAMPGAPGQAAMPTQPHTGILKPPGM